MNRFRLMLIALVIATVSCSSDILPTAAPAKPSNAVEISNELYKNGLTSFLAVIDAERSLYQTEDELVQSQRTVTVNLVALYKALGGGWQTSTVDGQPQVKR